MVEFVDGSVLAQLSRTDMCFPIQYALTWPDRVPGGLKPLNFGELSKLEFEEPRDDVFPALGLAREAGLKGGTLPAVFNAANEVAVDAFIERKIGFTEIWELVGQTMNSHSLQPSDSLENLIEADSWARGHASDQIGEGDR
jgi:1-deoxy-D-xylulose-5-phosphate reductoisomerase